MAETGAGGAEAQAAMSVSVAIKPAATNGRLLGVARIDWFILDPAG